MNFPDFILAHQADDLGALALMRDRLQADVPDFDLALTTLEVRGKIRTKVPEWYAVPGLQFPLRISGEQCSSSETARYKAGTARSHGRFLADLTGGLGVDSWAFSKVFERVLYNEMKPELAAAARHNFELLGAGNIELRNMELVPGGLPAVLQDFKADVIFLDPARRASDGRKVFRLEDCQPNVLGLLPELFAAAPTVMLKLSPMADITLVYRQLGSVAEVHVVAADGECKELLLLLERGYEGEIRTFVYESGAVVEIPGRAGDDVSGMTVDDVSGMTVDDSYGVPEAGDVLFEPGKGLLKAGAFDFPCRYGMAKIGRHTHLYVGAVADELRPFGKCYSILEVLPFNNKTIKELKSRYPQADVTARNIPITSEALAKKIGCRPGSAVHIFGLHADSPGGNLLLVCK